MRSMQIEGRWECVRGRAKAAWGRAIKRKQVVTEGRRELLIDKLRREDHARRGFDWQDEEDFIDSYDLPSEDLTETRDHQSGRSSLAII